MRDKNKPLFSRPVLAAIMLFSTLAIWLLNLTAPSAKLPTPDIEQWTTDSGIPVVWLNQDAWQGSDKLEIRFSFRAVTTDTKLIQSTLAMLMSDALPLSTASINQRLSPLAAKATTYYDHENQLLGITVSNNPSYLVPSLKLTKSWLTQTAFKSRTFDNWQGRNPYQQTVQHELEQILFFQQNTPPIEQISLTDVKEYYQKMTQSVATIYIIGDMSEQSQNIVKAGLNAITASFSPTSETEKSHSETINLASLSALIQQNQGALWQTRSALALSPVNTVQEWLSLQIWGADLVDSLNAQEHIDFVQLALALSPHHPWVWWNVQYSQTNQRANVSNIATGEPDISLKSFVFVEQVPSIKDKKRFEQLLENLIIQLEENTLSPTWWSVIAGQFTHPDSKLTLETFALDYKEAVDAFRYEDYQTALKQLINAQTYQEIQVYQ
ncbi:insulinase family protein [Marinomonas posidonica]|uniref:insulinase family protein n=1 Tax=Marinomonas posidonica TaxID=936476 RepID=UPI003736E4E2